MSGTALAAVVGQQGSSNMAMNSFQIVMWTLCGIATLFLASRFAIRISTKGRLMMNDYFLCAAIPSLFTALGLLQSTLSVLYAHQAAQSQRPVQCGSAAPRFASAIEMLWITIYLVKFCFLAQFKFHKPPYAYVSVHLTRFYWSIVSLCGAAFLFTLVQPIVLCPAQGKCRYFQAPDTLPWEVAVTALDIVTDLLVISIPILLIYMANFTRSHTIINASFKSLSVFAIAIAATRLGLQLTPRDRRVNYVSMTFWLTVEAAATLVMASISSYRVVVLDFLAEKKLKRRVAMERPKAQLSSSATKRPWRSHRPLEGQLESQSELPIIQPPLAAASSGIT